MSMTANEVQALYLALFERPADSGGQSYWEGGTAYALGNAALYSPLDSGTGIAVPITSSNIAAEIANVYSNLLGAASTSAQASFWQSQYAAGENIGQIADAIYNTVNSLNPGSPYYSENVTMTERIAAAQNITDTVLPFNNATYVADGQMIIGPSQTYNLTTGIDNIALSSDFNVVNGIANSDSDQTLSTFNAGDSITAASGTTGNVLNLTDAYAQSYAVSSTASVWQVLSSPQVTVQGIGAANLYTAESINVDTTLWTGLTALNVNCDGESSSSSYSSNDVITAASTTAVTVNDVYPLLNSSGAVRALLTVNGGSSVTVDVNQGAHENNLIGAPVGLIAVNGGSGTKSVAINETYTGSGYSDIAVINDVNYISTSSSATGQSVLKGVIADVTLTGFVANSVFTEAVIGDSALTSLTANNDSGNVLFGIYEGAYIDPAAALTLNVSDDTLNASGQNLTVFDVNSSYRTLTVNVTGADASFVELNFAGASSLAVNGTSQLALTNNSTVLSSVSSIAVSGTAGLAGPGYAPMGTFGALDLAGDSHLTNVTADNSGATDSINYIEIANKGVTYTATSSTALNIVQVDNGLVKESIHADISGYTGTGTMTGNEIIFNAPGQFLSPADLDNNTIGYGITSGSGSVSGFTVFGTGASSMGVYDMSIISNASDPITSIDVNTGSFDAGAGKNGNAYFVNVAPNTVSMSIDGPTGYNATPVTYGPNTATTANIYVTLNDVLPFIPSPVNSQAFDLILGIAANDPRVLSGVLNPTTCANDTVIGSGDYTMANTLTLTDSGYLTNGNTVAQSNGPGVLNVVSNNIAVPLAGDTNTINTLVDNGLNTLNISGTGAVMIGSYAESLYTGFQPNTSMTINNLSSGTDASGFGNFTNDFLTTLIFSGTGYTGITGLLTDTISGSAITFDQNDTNPKGVTINDLFVPNEGTLYFVSGSNKMIVNDLYDYQSLVTIQNTNSNTHGLTIDNLIDNGVTQYSVPNTNPNGLSGLTFTGAGYGTIGNIQTSDSGAFTINDTANLGKDTVTLHGASSSAVATAITSESLNSTSGSTLTVTDNSGANLGVVTLQGAVNYTNAAMTYLGGLHINQTTSSTGNVNVTITGINTAGDSINLVGSGNSTVSLATSANAITDQIFLGNGNNSVAISDALTNKTSVAITLGSGTNQIDIANHSTAGTLGTPVIDSIIFSAANAAGGANGTTLTSIVGLLEGASINAYNYDTISFAYAAVNSNVDPLGAAHTLAAGIAAVDTQIANGNYGFYTFNTQVDGNINTYLYEHAAASGTGYTDDELVLLVGTAANGQHTVTGVTTSTVQVTH